MPQPTYSVLDLGSNSFHMIHARVEGGRIVLLDKFKQYVSLGSGLRADGSIRRQYRLAAFHCLHEARRVLRRQDPTHFAAVATNAFRRQGDPRFHARCERELGRPIRVLTSIEEGQYIYRGVVGTTPQPHPVSCILDIGGSSTEFILGNGGKPICILSWQVGSAVLTRRFFAAPKLRTAHWEAAIAHTGKIITFAGRGDIHLPGVDHLQGASGAIRAISNTLVEHDISDGTIDAESVELLVELLLDVKPHAHLRHLDRYRTQVFLGGLAILHTLFALLDIRKLTVSRGAIREGVLLELHRQAQTGAPGD